MDSLMAKKRVHEIAKEQGMSAKALIAKLQAAGMDVKAAATAVDEQKVLAALSGNGGGNGQPAEPPPAPPAHAHPQRIPDDPPVPPRGDDPAAIDPAATQGGAEQRQRPTRSSLSGERAPGAGGGRRRVIIDSQASRRQQGGPPPPQRPPRRRGGRRRRGQFDDTPPPSLEEVNASRAEVVKIPSGSTVKGVAEYLNVPVPEVIKKLMQLGEMATLTQTLADEAIQVLADEFEKTIEVTHLAEEEEAVPEYEDADEDLVLRAPVVTIMGHVDHGKTSLLDAVRETEVAAGEAGGITQHIGAYQVRHADKPITFLDTPGHEAFTAMRARGAQSTDIAVIVVAADDGVKPQTEEAIDHARAAEVPIVVAVNKIDKEGDLLDTIQVVADLEELKANPEAEASGVVIESKLDPGRGPVVTVLVQRGTLRVGDAVVSGAHFGKVRALQDYTGKRIKQVVPGQPAEVLGFDSVPDAGE